MHCKGGSLDLHVTRLEAWCSAARQLLNPPARSARAEYDALLKYVHARVLRSLHGLHGVTHVNGKCPLVTLPEPVLRQILLQVDVLDRCMLAAACKHLRGRCHALAVLRPVLHIQPLNDWRLHVPSTTSLEHAVNIARQSLPNGLGFVTLTWWPELSIELAQFLSENIARIQSLRIDFPNTVFRHPECARALFALLETPAPILTDLHLTMEPPETQVLSSPIRIRSRFGLPDLPIPVKFMLDAFGSPLSGQHLSSLLRLRIFGMRLPLKNGLVFVNVLEFCWFHGAPATLDRETLASLVDCFPRIETLRLRCAQVSWAPAALPVRSSLRHVHVDECGEIGDLSSFLAGTTISLLTFTHPLSISSGKLLETLSRESVSISYGSSHCEIVARPRSPTASQQVIRYQTSISTIERRCFVFSLRQATCLTLPEFLWPRALTFASASAFSPESSRPFVFAPEIFLPALTRLRISLSPCRAHLTLHPLLHHDEDHSVAGILLGLHGPLSPLRTPALKELEIFYAADTAVVPTPLCRCHNRTLSVSLCDIHRFVASCIRLPTGRRLEQIRINGVEVVDPDPFPHVELLEQLSDVVSISPVPSPNGYDPGTTLYANNYDYIRRDQFAGFY